MPPVRPNNTFTLHCFAGLAPHWSLAVAVHIAQSHRPFLKKGPAYEQDGRKQKHRIAVFRACMRRGRQGAHGLPGRWRAVDGRRPSRGIGRCRRQGQAGCQGDVRGHGDAVPAGLRIVPTGVTAEGERVAVEAESSGVKTDGKAYNSLYHFLFVVRDGKIQHVREYCDLNYVQHVFG